MQIGRDVEDAVPYTAYMAHGRPMAVPTFFRDLRANRILPYS